MTSHALTLQQLEIFSAVARRGSFVKAAEALSMSQPAVSYHMSQLEAILGTRLIERASRRPIQLTASGRRLLKTCDAVIEQLNQGTQEINALRRAEGGTIAFAARPLFYDYVFPHLYASFRQRYPQINVAAETVSREEMIRRLLDRELDVAIMVNPAEDPRLSNHMFAVHDLIIVGPPGHPLSQEETPVPFEVLAAEPFIRTANENAYAWQVIEAEAKNRGVKLNFSWKAEDAEAQMNAVRSGLGVAALPLYAVSRALVAGTLVRLYAEPFPMRFHWHLVTAGSDVSPLTERFKEHLLHEVEGLREMLSLPESPRVH